MFAMGPGFFRAANAPSYDTLTITGTFPGGTVGTAYDKFVTISGGETPYTLTGGTGVASGSLPAGLSLSIQNADELHLSGTPTTAETADFTDSVDSADGQTATSMQSVVVAASVTDPYWSSVVALLHLDGTAGSTLITDEVDGTTWVVHGDAHVSNSATLFGGNCFAFDGAGDFLSTPYSAKYDISADFTIEAFVNPASVAAGTYYSVCSKREVSTAGWSFEVGNNVSSGQIRFRGNFGGTWSESWALSSPGAISAGTFTHIAVTRAGNTLRTFAGGMLVGSSTVTGGLLNSIDDLRVGNAMNGGENFLSGFLRELRITKGVARYTSNFTPPTAPFPNA